MCAAKAGEFYLYASALFMKSFEVENYVVLCYQHMKISVLVTLLQ